jgi:hypothetical protein
MYGQNPEIKLSTPIRNSNQETFNNDFEESLKYLNDIAEQEKQKIKNENIANTTLKNYQSMNPESILSNTYSEPFSHSSHNQSTTPIRPYGNDISIYEPSIHPTTPSFSIKSQESPKWGCMKGGNLPTYRLWKNQTQRNNVYLGGNNIQSPSTQIPMNPLAQPSIVVHNPSPQSQHIQQSQNVQQSHHHHNNLTSNSLYYPNIGGINDNQRSIMRQTMNRIDNSFGEKKSNLKYLKRKKTIRRTYKVGKSKTAPKVSVLISNKTIRKNISTKTQQLKQVPIEQIRTELMKRGFIKIGSIAPNDVLRQMYESMTLVCGEVENHNPDNLMYNFFNT